MKTFFILFMIFSTVSVKAQYLEREIKIQDLTANGPYNDKWEWSLDGRELGKIYVDKIKWIYQETSENPYTAIAYKIEYFKQTEKGIINYQMVTGQEENFEVARYYWTSDTTATINFYNGVAEVMGRGVMMKQSQMGGTLIDHIEKIKKE